MNKHGTHSWIVVLATILAACGGGGSEDAGPMDGAPDSVCGDGTVQGSEICDDGNIEDGDGCASTCLSDETCGNGVHDVVVREACDDGNDIADDGCESDCTRTCFRDLECQDLDVCNGPEVCNRETWVCESGTALGEGEFCTEAEREICLRGNCVEPECGDGLRQLDEACDDGNDIAGDGCEDNCTFSCEQVSDCVDALACNGTESCDLDSHICVSGTDSVDGALCDADGNGATRDVCLLGACGLSECGDGFVDSDAGEVCDDGNDEPGDGCEDCTFDCTDDPDCDDGIACNGSETCDGGSRTCLAGTRQADGTTCDADAMPATRDICIVGSCSRSVCGDGVVDRDDGEQCEDGNDVPRDGCDDDCTFSCESNGGCDDGDPCNGEETCNVVAHVCRIGTPEDDGTECDADGMSGTRDLCVEATCAATRCGDGYVDGASSEVCDDNNAISGDGCEASCQWTPSAFRIIEIELMQPHTYTEFFGCNDTTGGVNNLYQVAIDELRSNNVLVFSPVDPAAPTTQLDVHPDATCMATAGRDACQPGSTATMTSAVNRVGSGACVTHDAARLNATYVVPNEPASPCFASPAGTLTIDLGAGARMVLTSAVLAATYDPLGAPTLLLDGVIGGFLSEADARALFFPAATPVVGGTSYYSHLGAGGEIGSSCEATIDDRHEHAGEMGFWFYFNFTASPVDWAPM